MWKTWTCYPPTSTSPPPRAERAADLGYAIAAHVTALNADYTEPLPDSEAACIARSITNWITTESRLWVQSSTVTQTTFTTIQSARARRPRPLTEKMRAANAAHGFQPKIDEAALVREALR